MPTVPIDGGRLWYEERGEGPPLVCIHGGWQDADSWRRQVDRFADDYRVVTFDLRGHGRTGPTDVRRYSIDLFVDDLDRLLAHLDVDRPVLAGVSIGGMVIQSYLAERPDAARAAVIGGPLRSMPPFAIPSTVKLFLSPVPAIAWLVSTIGVRPTFRSLLTSIRATTGAPWLTIDGDVRSRALDALDPVTPAEFRKIFGALYGFRPPELSHVETPTLVVWGDHEAPPVKVQARRLAASLANATGREIQNAGHLVNQDNPGAFEAACSALFADLAGAEPPARSP